MRQVTPRWREMVKSTPRWITQVQWSNDGARNWKDATYTDGTVTADATAQCRWSCDLTLQDVTVGREGINPYTTRIRVLHGMAGERPLAMGVYRVNTSSQSRANRDQIKVSGESFESYVIDAGYDTPHTIRETTAEDAVRLLITQGLLNRATIVWRPGVNSSQRIPQIVATESRWDVIDGDADSASIAKSVGAVVYCGGAGEWIVAPPGSLSDTPTWAVNEAEMLIDATVDQDRDGVYNTVVVRGEPPNGLPVGPIIVRDDDPTSITYWNKDPDDGGFGRRPLQYTSPLITNDNQARKTAASMLAQHLGLRQSVSFSSLHDPSMEPGDVGYVDTPQGRLRMILDSVTYDLKGGPMSATTRTTSTYLTGTTQEFVDAGTQ